MAQLNDDEQKPSMLKRNALALVQGSPYEEHLKSDKQKRKFMRRLRDSPLAGGGTGLTAVPKMVVDNRRWMWLTYTNVDRYFDGLKYFYLSEGFGDDEPEVQSDGATSELTFSEVMKARLSVGDETHQLMSNAGDKSGPKATTYVNPLVKRSGARHVVSPKHITVYVFMNANGEMGSFTAIFDTSATEEEDRRVCTTWTAGLPRVQAQWGHDEVYTHEPVILVTPKGGTSEDALEKIIESALVPLYPPGSISPMWQYDENDKLISGPICHRLDGGPGRTGTSSLPMRMRLAEKGIFLFPSGPQNCTAATQEPDQMFDVYKGKCNAITDEIVAERIKARAAAEKKLRDAPDAPRRINNADLPKVELSNADFPRVVNGRHGAPVERRPFSHAFSREKVLKAHAKVGAVPLTRAALLNPKVRKELDREEEAGGIVREIVTTHQANLSACSALNLDTTAMDVELPRRFELVAPPTAEEEIILKLKEGGCSQAATWVTCGAVAFNSSVVNKAGVAMVKDAVEKKSDAAASELARFVELKEHAKAIWDRMYEEEIEYDSLKAGEPKVLVQYYFKASGKKGITAACSSVNEMVEFLFSIEDEDYERLFLLDAPPGYKPIEEVDSVAARLLTDMSKSVIATIDGQRKSERESVLALTGLAGAVDEEEEPNVGQTIDAKAAGLDSVLPAEARLFKLPPPAAMLKLNSPSANALKGREIVRRFKEGWFVGRVLVPASDASVKDGQRVANFRVFYEADGELLNQSLYPNTYASGSVSAVGSWMVVASRDGQAGSGHLALLGQEPLALMPPRSQ